MVHSYGADLVASCNVILVASLAFDSFDLRKIACQDVGTCAAGNMAVVVVY